MLHKIKTILIPWLIFAFADLALHIVKTRCSIEEVLSYGKSILLGTTRNGFLPGAGAIWFFTCLFVTQLIFWFIRRLKNKWLILGASVAVHLLATVFFYIHDPKLPFNLDSALFYVLFYAVGYVSFEYIDRFMGCKKPAVRVSLILSGAVAVVYSGLRILGNNLLGFLDSIPVISSLASAVGVLAFIYVVILISKVFENIDFLREIGQNTMYLCAGEFIVKSLVNGVLSIFSLKIVVESAVQGVLLAAIFLALALKIVVPVLKFIVNNVVSLPSRFKKEAAKETGGNKE